MQTTRFHFIYSRLAISLLLWLSFSSLLIAALPPMRQEVTLTVYYYWVLALLERMKAEDFKQKAVEIIVTVVETPLGFFEVKDEVIETDAPELCETQFGETPKGFDAVDVVFSTGELVFMMMNPMVFVAAQDEAVVGLPAIGINGGFGKHLPLHNRHKLLLGAVLDDGGEDFSSAFEQANYGRLPACSAPAFAPHSPCAEVTLVHFDFSGKRTCFLYRQLQNPKPQFVVKSLRRLRTQPGESRARERRNVRTKQLQYCSKFHFRNVRVMDVSVSQ